MVMVRGGGHHSRLLDRWLVKRRCERFLFHLGYFLHGFSKYTDAFKHNPLSKGNDLRENAVVGAERSMQFFSVVFTRNHGCDLGPTRRDIITVRGQSYVSRLPKYWPPYPPAFVGGGGHTRRAERGVGGQYFGRRETQDCPLTVIISLRSYLSSL